MKSDEAAAVRDAIADHAAFGPTGDGFAVETSPFAAQVTVRNTDGGPRVDVEVVVPTLDAAVTGGEVAPVVREGWFETLSLRLEDVGGATRSDPDPPRVDLDASAGTVTIRTTITPPGPTAAVADAKAVVEYVEGTYVEGIIPGYEYGDPVSGLVSRARAAGTGADSP